jgi:hypothetical protein
MSFWEKIFRVKESPKASMAQTGNVEKSLFETARHGDAVLSRPALR